MNTSRFEKPTTRKKATEEELESLEKFHRDGFRYWPKLNDDCKLHVMSFVDMFTLTRLGRTSKSEKVLADGVPGILSSIELRVYSANNSTVIIRGSERDEVTVDFWDGRVVTTKKSGVRSVIAENMNLEHAGVHYFNRMMEKCRNQVEAISVNSSDIPATPVEPFSPNITFLPLCRSASLVIRKADQQHFWLSKLPVHLDELVVAFVHFQRPLTNENLWHPQIEHAHVLRLHQPAGFTDQHLLALAAAEIYFVERPPLVTTAGLNAFLSRWASGNGRPNFVHLHILHCDDIDHFEIARDLFIERHESPDPDPDFAFRVWSNIYPADYMVVRFDGDTLIIESVLPK